MKKRIGLGMVALTLTAMGAHGAIVENLESFSSGGNIPDGNPVGITVQGNVGNFLSDSTVTAVTVGLNISGGYAGNLYAYLVGPNGTMVTLLNQAGGGPFGNPSSTINMSLQDGAGAITSSSDLSSGTYAAAGNLSDMNGSLADGTWTLFFADIVSGGGTSHLNGWSLDITAVPEPANEALLVFAGLGGLWWLGRRLRGKSIPAAARTK